MTLTIEEYTASRLAELDRYQQHFSNLFYFLENEELMFIPEGEQWCAIEVIEHLNAEASLYLDQWRALINSHCKPTDRPISLGWVATKLRSWMEGPVNAQSKWIQSPKSFLPRRLVNAQLKLDPQKVIETFIADLEETRKIIAELPKLSCRSKRVKTAASIRIGAIAALELYLPHIGRHMNQAERILTGARSQQAAQ